MTMKFEMPYRVSRVPVFARNMVAVSQPLAAQAGLNALRNGGNAVDAALAAAITLTVVEPTGNGLGSDAFAIVWDGHELHGLNASGRSPAAWDLSRFSHLPGMPERGWESVTVPGAVSAWVELSGKFGKLPFEDLFENAIRYAFDGFAVSPQIASLWESGGRLLHDHPGFAETFLPNGNAPKAGELFVNKPLAASLEEIAGTRGEAFYRGSLAENIAAFAKRHGAQLTVEDMAAHTADWCGTISQSFHGAELHEIPPNGQGLAALIAVGILNHLDLDPADPDSVENLHLQIEATKLGLQDAWLYISDPKSMRMDVSSLLDDGYLRSRAALVSRDSAGEPTAGAPKAGGTVYLSTADSDGMMVSFIQSNYAGFGSGVVVPGTGIHLQNRGSGFSLDPGHPNVVAGGKRPFHTIIPGFVMKDAAPLMSFGVMGGPMQAQGHVQMLVRTQLFKQNPQAASDAPRWRVVSGKKLAVEWTMPPATVAGLEALGHTISTSAPDASYAFGGAQLIHRFESGYVAGSDHRKDGVAAGF